MAPVLGSSSNSPEADTRPLNAEAYEFYLRSLALNDDIKSNQEAIGLLDQATSLDPNYAPAWYELALRHYDLGSFGGGSEEEIRKSENAAERAQKLDPNFIRAGAILGRIWTEERSAHQRHMEKPSHSSRGVQKAAMLTSR